MSRRNLRKRDDVDHWDDIPLEETIDKNKDSEFEGEHLDEGKEYDLEQKRPRVEPAQSSLGRQQNMAQLKEDSRQRYLQTREAQQLEILRARIDAEQELFSKAKISSAEAERLRLDQEIFKLAQSRRALEANPQVYHMPDEKKPSAEVQTEGRDWEETQIEKAKVKSVETPDFTEYDFVVDQADFEEGEQLADAEAPEPEEFTEPTDPRELIAKTRKSLPIYGYREELLEAINDHQILIVVGETGSGKTTQLPQYLVEEGYTKTGLRIGCTQPRRVAAMSVATRVAEEMGVRLGYEVGYSVRFEDCTSVKTRLKYMTDGMLLREVLDAPELPGYGVIIVDEAHERTLHTDILFGLLKDLARHRPDLKLIIASATLDAERFSDYFGGAPIFTIPGRRYPVDILYTRAPEADYLAAAMTTVMQIHMSQPLPGDILVFLTGQDEIETIHENLTLISKRLGSSAPELIIAPIYAALPAELQAGIFKPTPAGARKVVLATNIAETSITIDGIVYVIDPGFVKLKTFNARTGTEALLVTPCSRASAQQRAGRAGRVAPGKCFRLYTSWAFQHELSESTPPEITRSNLASVLLLLKTLGIHDLLGFDFLDKPAPDAMLRALEQLYALGALNDKGELTRTGRRMAEFPLDPMMAKALLASEEFNCSSEVVSIMAMLSVQGNLFYRPKEKKLQADTAKKALSDPTGDHLTLLSIWKSWEDSGFSSSWCFENYLQTRSMKRARDVRDQLVGLLSRVEIPLTSSPDNHASILKAILAGYFPNAAKLQVPGETYRAVKHGQPVHIHPSSALFGADPKPNWVLFHELVLTSKEFMRQCSQIEPEWIVEAAPHYYKASDILGDGKASRKLPKAIGRPSLK